MFKALNKIIYIESLRHNLTIHFGEYAFSILLNSLFKFNNNNSYVLFNIFYNDDETMKNIKYYYINPNIIQMAKYA